jgi:hypothetical protein
MQRCAHLTAVDRPEAAAMRESLDYLIVDDDCDWGCDSFGVRDTRVSRTSTRLTSGGTTRV